MKPKIVVVGSSNTDMIIRLKRVPRLGETVLGGNFLTAGGGKGANQAVAASRAGGRVSLIARVGQDSLGDEAIKAFRKNGIEASYVTRDRDLASGAALIFVDGRGENCIAVASGANAGLSPAQVHQARAVISRAKVLLLQLETPMQTVIAAARLAKVYGVQVILNPAPARRLPSELLRCVSILTPNESEAELLTGIRLSGLAAAKKAANKLVERGVGTVVLTLGARGALIANDEVTQVVPGFRVKAVDTTGAGDTFNGALAVALAEGKPLSEAVHIANAAAAISVTRVGAQSSAPTKQSIARFLGRVRRGPRAVQNKPA